MSNFFLYHPLQGALTFRGLYLGFPNPVGYPEYNTTYIEYNIAWPKVTDKPAKNTLFLFSILFQNKRWGFYARLDTSGETGELYDVFSLFHFLLALYIVLWRVNTLAFFLNKIIFDCRKMWRPNRFFYVSYSFSQIISKTFLFIKVSWIFIFCC